MNRAHSVINHKWVVPASAVLLSPPPAAILSQMPKHSFHSLVDVQASGGGFFIQWVNDDE